MRGSRYVGPHHHVVMIDKRGVGLPDRVADPTTLNGSLDTFAVLDRERLDVMRIAVLHPSREGSTSSFVAFDPECDPTRYLRGPEYTHVRIAKATAVRQVVQVARAGFDVVVNLCDGAWDEDRPGVEVIHALERLNVAFTGAGSSFYDPSRTAMKMAAHAAGVRVPAYVMAQTI